MLFCLYYGAAFATYSIPYTMRSGFEGFLEIMEEIVEKLVRIEKELKLRKDRDKLAAYNAGEKKHEKQLAFHKCLKRNRWVFGGNRSGKTECGAVECVYLARG